MYPFSLIFGLLVGLTACNGAAMNAAQGEFTETGAGPATTVSGPGAGQQPLLVLVHGRDQTGQDPSQLESRWNKAVDDGLVAIGANGSIPTNARRFVWYGDVFGQPRPELPDECRFAALSAPTDMMERLRRALVRIAERAHLDQPLAKQFVGDTYQFLSDLTYRCQTLQRLSATLDETVKEKRPIVLVAHSMGGIVSIALLHRNSSAPIQERYRVSRLVTMGTQIGVKEVLQAIEGSMVQLPVPEPQNIQTWVNLKNEGDPLAFSVRSAFKATDPTRLPLDEEVPASGPNRHSVELYLRQPRTAFSILEAWCRAAPHASGQPCSEENIEAIRRNLPS